MTAGHIIIAVLVAATIAAFAGMCLIDIHGPAPRNRPARKHARPGLKARLHARNAPVTAALRARDSRYDDDTVAIFAGLKDEHHVPVHEPELADAHVAAGVRADLGGELAGQPGKNGGDEAGLIGPHMSRSLPSPALPEDPYDVATPEQHADALVGDLGPREDGRTPPPMDNYREETGSWTKLTAEVLAEMGGER